MVFAGGHQQFLAVGSKASNLVPGWPERELSWRGTGTMKKAGRVCQSEDIPCSHKWGQFARGGRAKDVIAAIGSPEPAALVGRTMPARQDGVQVRAVRASFPDCGCISVTILNGETNSAAVRRKREPLKSTLWDGDDLLWIRSILCGQPELRALPVYQPLSIG